MISCSNTSIYRVSITQGTVFKQEDINKLEVGMTKDQVIYVMGQPSFENFFEKNVWNYFYQIKSDVALKINESVVIDDYRIEYNEKINDDRSDRLAQWANMTVYKINKENYSKEINETKNNGNDSFILGAEEAIHNEKVLGKLQPWHGFYTNFNMASVRSGIKSSIYEDLYVIPRDFLEDERVSLSISINPLAVWLWISGPIFILGTMIALWPNKKLEGGK